MSEVILVGGSKDGTIAEGSEDLKAVNNIVLDDTLENPEFIDLYMPTNVTDKEGRAIYAHIGRYDATESASYWATLSQQEKDDLKAAAEAAKEFVEEKPEEKAPETEAKPAEAVVEEKEVVRDGSEIDDPVETEVEEAKSDEPVVEDKEAGKVDEAGSDDAKSDEGADGATTDEVVEVEEDKKD